MPRFFQALWCPAHPTTVARGVMRGLAAFGTCVLIAVLASSAVAQPASVPVRVVQGSDGSLYVVQGGKSWTLVPDQLSDADVDALHPSSEIDGVLPDDLVGCDPWDPRCAAAAVAAPPAAPASTGCASPLTGTVDLTGKVASAVPGTCIAVGATVSSEVEQSKPQDVYALPLTAGRTYQFSFTSPNNYGNGWVNVALLKPDSSVAMLGRAGNPNAGCNWGDPHNCVYTPSSDDTHYLVVSGHTPGARYTFNIKQM